ncbi:MAG: amidohydrolase family protein, partial [Candidatus Aminicenantales bacterium]
NFHHFIPRTLHSNKWFKSRYSREEMQKGVHLCKTCHSAIHNLIPKEKDLGRLYNNREKLLAHPLVGVGSDGQAVAPYGPLSKGKPHPRFYGTFPRVLGKYVREEKVAALEEMVRKMTSMPADHLGLARSGLLKEGCAADIAVFDPARVIDKAAWTAPARYPEGIPHVVVNGRVVVQNGEHTGNLPGRVLKRNSRGVVE